MYVHIYIYLFRLTVHYYGIITFLIVTIITGKSKRIQPDDTLITFSSVQNNHPKIF